MTKIENNITLAENDLGNEGKGSYVLLIELPEEQTITIGSLKTVHFHQGYFAYVGSAMGGFKTRLDRHLTGNKRPHWHIDYLLLRASINDIILCQTHNRAECTIAGALSRQFDAVPGFGSSDCKCHSHLFFTNDENQMKAKVMSNLDLLGIKASLRTGKERTIGHYRSHTLTEKYQGLQA